MARTKEKTMSNGKRFWMVLFTALGSLLLIVGLLIASIEMFAVNARFFHSEYSKLDTAQNIGISEEDLTKVTDKLLNYTTDTDDNLDIQAEIQGQMQEVFGQREKDHMVDVKVLYLGARNVRTVSLICAVLLFTAAFIIGRKHTWQSLCKSFLWVSAGFVVFVAAIGIYAAIDFTSFWTNFHHVFFTNDLWLLDPRTDVLIQMVPEQFFSDLVTRIIVRFISIFITLNAASMVGLAILKRRENAAAKG
jgi:integral membrane protein (TIGR01906 family)